jgi:hypothetical protein
VPTSTQHFASVAAQAAHRRHRRGREVDGPYRSQSSNPEIRAQASPHEHRRLNPFDRASVSVPSALQVPDLAHLPPAPAPVDFSRFFKNAIPTRLEDPYTAFDMARFHAVQPPAILRREWRRDYGPGIYAQVQHAALAKIASEEALEEPADLTNLIVGAATLGGGLWARGALSGADAAAGAVEGASAGGRASTALRLAGRALSFPVRHPVITGGSPLAAQAPLAAFHGNPGELKKALEGTGVLAAALGGAGKGVEKAVPGVAGHAIADALSLPAQVLPSTYLTTKAAAKAIGGDPEELNALRQQFQQTSAFPALLSGHLGEAAERAQEHPLYTALEALALKAGVGLGAGAIARRLRIPGTGHELRPDLVAYGDVAKQQGPYSNDLITRFFQRRSDAARPRGADGEVLLRPREVSRHLRSALDREVFAGEQVRRGNQRQVAHELNAAKPADQTQADVVSHAIQGIARNPDRAVFDLQSYRDELVAQQPNLTASELTANRRQIEAIDAALANPNPDAIYSAVRTFVDQQRPITEGLVERGLLDPQQARKAIAIPYARVHMDAGYGLSRADLAEEARIREAMKQSGLSPQERGQLLGSLSRVRAKMQTLSSAGDPLTLDAIEQHMRDSGIEPAGLGFVTQRAAPASGPASFFQPPNERAQLPRQRRTGEATARGTFDPSWDAVVQQAIHGRTILDRVHNFEHLVDRFGLRSPDGRAFKDSAEAKRAAEHPEDFNMQLPDVPGGWRPFRLSPWLAKKAEAEAASGLGHNNALEADHPTMVENFSADAIKNALEPGDGPVVLMPKVVTDRMRQHFQEIYPVEKSVQAITGAFKGAVLPTSPKWAAGNALDNYVVRSFGTGITPRDMLTGRRFARLFEKELTPEQRARALESIVPGGLYGSYARIQPYRALEQFAGTKIEPLARAAHAVLTSPGVRTVAELYRRYRDTVFELDSKYVEQLPQYGQLSKQARHELGMTRRQFRNAINAEAPVVMDLIRGFRNPEHVDHFAKSVENVFGNWGKNGPEARRFLTTWAPFWMWGRAAIKFAFVTLPRDHPLLTGLIAASEQMTREEREKLGFDFAGKEPLPGFLQGGIPSGGGGVTALGSLTTFGTFSDLPQFLASVPAPQFSSAILAGLGIDWKGDRLVDGKGRPASDTERIKAAVLGTADAFIPFLNVGRAISTRGAAGLSPFRSYPKSTVDYLRGLHNTQTIHVPIKEGGEGGGSSNPFESAELGGGEESNPFDSFSP